MQSNVHQRNLRLPSISYTRSIPLASRGLYKFLDDFDFLVDRDGALIKNPLRNLEVPGCDTAV